MAPDREGPFAVHNRHYPAAIRALSVVVIPPQLPDWILFGAVRHLTLPEAKRAPTKIKPKNESEEALQRWICSSPVIRSWWANAASWRAPREWKGWRALEKDLGVPHLEPFEFAEMRLPEDIAMDADVVLLQAWCQGLIGKWQAEVVARWSGWADPHGCMVAGLRKVHSSPWVKLSLAAPHMQPVGVLFPNVGYIDACRRMAYLLEFPYRSTIPELHHILRSPGFLASYERARITRRRGTYLNPGGGWYACGMRSPLGGHFRRSGVWTGRRGSK